MRGSTHPVAQRAMSPGGAQGTPPPGHMLVVPLMLMLGTLIATRVWAFWPSGPMLVALRLGATGGRAGHSLLEIQADGCPKVGDIDCHSGVGFLVIGADDSCPETGNFVCHSGVDFWAFGADGCPKAPGDFVCHSGVDFWAIGADGCPKAGDFVCHLSVDF